MRGKNIIWLSLIAMLVGMFCAPAMAPSTATAIRVNPAEVTGIPGEYFDLQITIENGYDVYAWEVDLQIVPLQRVISPVNYIPGDYIDGTLLKYYDYNSGQIKLGTSKIGPVSGAYGDGWLATITFQVLEAGTSPLELINFKLVDSYGNLMPATLYSGQFTGPTLDLVMKEILPGRVIPVGTTGSFNAKIKNPSTVPLYARVRWDLVREDGVMYNTYSGQSFWTQAPPSVYLYVNAFTGHYGEGWGWYYEGTGPYLNAVGDGNYVWTDAAGMEEGEYPGYYPYTGRYDFDDLALAGRAISQVTIEAYTMYEYYDEANDLDTYMRRPDQGGPSVWIGSLWGTTTWDWHTVRWTNDNVAPDNFPQLLTQDGINLARVRFIMYWTADDLEHGKVWIDALRLKVDFSPVSPVDPPYVIIDPGTTMQMPAAYFYPLEYDVGVYRCTVFAEYRYNPPPPPGYAVVWNRGVKIPPTFKIFVKP